MLHLFAKNLEQKHKDAMERVSHSKSPAKVLFDITDGGMDGNDANGDDRKIGTANAWRGWNIYKIIRTVTLSQ